MPGSEPLKGKAKKHGAAPTNGSASGFGARLRGFFHGKKLPKISIRSEAGAQDTAAEESVWRQWLNHPGLTFALIAIVSVALLIFGWFMVLSAQTTQAALGGGNPLYRALKPTILLLAAVVVGIIVYAIGYRRMVVLGYPIFAITLGLQLAVFTSLGRTIGGNRNWLALGPVQFQPSELLKFGLVLAIGSTYALFGRDRKDHHKFIIVFAMLSAVSLLAVLAGHDMGTAIVFVAILLCVVVILGMPLKWLIGFGILGAFGAGVLAASSSSRLARIKAYFAGIGGLISGKPDMSDERAYQVYLARLGLGNGGLTGVGPGGSIQKWDLLPEADSDFIFAIIGEEWGFLGSLIVIVLFALLLYGIYRLATRVPDRLVQILAVAIGGWLLTQATINIMVVIGLLPVIGVPLPLISSGGSSLVASVAAIALLLSCARSEPGADAMVSAQMAGVKATFSQRRKKDSNA